MTGTRKICNRCGADFGCANLGDGSRCWCAELPPVMPLRTEGDCLCPDCLKSEIARFTEQYVQDVAHGKCEHYLAGKIPMNTPPIEGIDYYQENGNFVLRGWYLLKRGYCCGNGCRHCPYPKTAI